MCRMGEQMMVSSEVNPMLRTLVSSAVVAVLSLPWQVAWATQPTVDVILVRKNCGGAGPLCFDDAVESGNALAKAIQEVHDPSAGRERPSASHRVVVDIGAGTFEFDDAWLEGEMGSRVSFCTGTSEDPISHLTYRGAGKWATRLTTKRGSVVGPIWEGGKYAMVVEHCDEFTVESLEIFAEDQGTESIPTEEADLSGVQSGVAFLGAGTSYWRSMAITASAIAWWEAESAPGPEDAVHYWYDSELSVWYINRCASQLATTAYVFSATHHFYRTNVVFISDYTANQPAGCPLGQVQLLGALYASNGFKLFAVDSVFSFATRDARNVVYGVFTGQSFGGCTEGNSSFEGSNNTIWAGPWGPGSVQTANGIRLCSSKYEWTDTTWGLDASTTKRRLFVASGTPTVRPHFHGLAANPPAIEATATGAETFIETDCSSTTGCSNSPAGAAHHFMTYDSSCTSKWYDSTRQECRP
jgi:hypothetical protein